MYQETTAISDEVRGFLDKSLWGTGQNNLGPSADDYGDLTFWAPTVNLDRDPRWGRTDEAFGEDPYLVGQMAGAFVDGYQGNTMSGQPHDRLPEGRGHREALRAQQRRGQPHRTARTPPTPTIRDYYTAQFRSLIENAHVSGLMTSYNAINGTPSLADTYTVNELLQRTYGFDGYITSDCGAIGDVYSPPAATTGRRPAGPPTASGTTDLDEHRDRAQVPAAAGGQAYALRAGTAAQLHRRREHADQHPGRDQRRHPQRGRHRHRADPGVHRADGDRRVRPGQQRHLHQDHQGAIQSPAHQALAEKVAANYLVLLKNDNVTGTPAPLLPADPAKLNKVVIVGDLANTVTLGDYSGDPTLQVNAVQGITAAVQAANPSATVIFDACGTSTTATGAALLGGAPRRTSRPPTWSSCSSAPTPNVATEGKDRTTLAMPGNYDSLINQIAALGNPRTALVIQSDGPVKIDDTQGDFPAIVFSGYNGESQGTALADVLFGKQNPTGHLDFTWYKDDSQLPAMKNYGLTPSQTGGLGRTYQYFTGTPDLPVRLRAELHHVRLLARRRSTGARDRRRHRERQLQRHQHRHRPGATVAQLYVATPFTVSGVELPKERLEGFQKTAVLQPGQTQHITLPVKVAGLASGTSRPSGRSSTTAPTSSRSAPTRPRPPGPAPST